MRIRIQQADLNNALRVVERAVATKNTIEVLTGVYLSAEGNRLTLRATDLEMGISTVTPCDTLNSGSVVLNAKVLSNLVRKAPVVELEIEVNPKTHFATVGWDKSRYTIPGYSSDQFPNPPDTDEALTVTISQVAFRRLLERTAFAVGEDSSKPWLEGVSFAIKGDTITANGADQPGFATATLTLPHRVEGTAHPIVKGDALNHLIRLLSEDDAPLSVSVGRQFVCDLGDTILHARLIDGSYPDLTRFLKPTFSTTVRTNRKALLEVVDRASSVVGHHIKFTVSGNFIRVQANEQKNHSASQEEVPALSMDGETLDVALNAKLLMDYLRVIDHSEVEMRFNGSRDPFIVAPVGDASTYYMLLPLITVQGVS